MVRVWEVLKDSGFVPYTHKYLGLGSSLAFDFGNFQLSAVGPTMNMSFRTVVVFSGTYRSPRTIVNVDFELPDTVESREQCWAWIAERLDRQTGGSLTLEKEPEWLATGRANQELLPWVKKRREWEEQQRIYAQRPHCSVEREWAKLLLRDLELKVAYAEPNEPVHFSYAGEVLRITLRESLLAVAARGNAWPHSYLIEAGVLHYFPKRQRGQDLVLEPVEGSLMIAQTLYPCLLLDK